MKSIVHEKSDGVHGDYHNDLWGPTVDNLYPNGHYFIHRTAFTEPDIMSKYNWPSRVDPIGAPSYTFSSYGFIVISAANDTAFTSTQTALAGDRTQVGFCVMLKNTWYVLLGYEANIGERSSKSSNLIPVAKGDTIYFGTMYDRDILPSEYDITFIPAKRVDAISGN